MITEQDLAEAIAECQGVRNPDSSTCIKLAAFYTIKNELFGNTEKFSAPSYSFAAPPGDSMVSYDSGSEFSGVIQGRKVNDVFTSVDRMMRELKALQPKMYYAILDEIEK